MPTWLNEQVVGNGPASPKGDSLLIVEAGCQEYEKYRLGHLPGAIYLDTNRFERAPDWNVAPPTELERVLLAHGITSEKPTLLYGRDPLAVARIALVLLYAGVEEVRWLAGGIEAWIAGGNALETGARVPNPAQAFGKTIPAHPEYIVDSSQVRVLLADPNAVVACVRTWEEFIGKASGYNYIEPKGRIAGSVWAGQPDFEVRQYTPGDTLERTLHRCQEVAANWRGRGITPEKHIVFYCGTGWRASQAFLCAWLMGWKDISIYDGGWLEWSADPKNPIEGG